MISINRPMYKRQRSGKRKNACLCIGIFLIALLLYMFADTKPNPTEAPPGHPNPSAELATPNNSTTATAGDEAVATDSNTATATDR